MKPAEYLDSLLDVVLSKRPTKPSKRLADKIARNKRGREPRAASSSRSVGGKKVSELEAHPEKFDIGSAFDRAAQELKLEDR